jgi:hypothetical protein
MARYHHNVYASATTPRFIVFFDLQWKIIECQRLEPRVDLQIAMSNAIRRLAEDGWLRENDSRFGFVFLNRCSVRRLLILTERDPHDDTPQSFSPFKTAGP